MAGLSEAQPNSEYARGECAAGDQKLSLRQLEMLIASRQAEGIPLEKFLPFQQVEGSSEFASKILLDPYRAAEWSNAVYALGAIGDERAFTSLVGFFKAPIDPITETNKLSRLTFNAKIDVLFALGYSVLHAPTPVVRTSARRLLDESTSTSAELWRDLEWTSPDHDVVVARNAYLASKVRLINRTLAQQRANEAAVQGDKSLQSPFGVVAAKRR